MLGDSYNLSLRYGNEYMDENPIVGEPGSFRLTKSHDASLTASMSTRKSLQASTVAPKAKEVEVPTPPPPLKTEDLPAPVRKGTKGAEKSPVTPGTKEKREKKERKKSKVVGSGSTTTPTATTPGTATPK